MTPTMIYECDDISCRVLVSGGIWFLAADLGYSMTLAKLSNLMSALSDRFPERISKIQRVAAVNNHYGHFNSPMWIVRADSFDILHDATLEWMKNDPRETRYAPCIERLGEVRLTLGRGRLINFDRLDWQERYRQQKNRPVASPVEIASVQVTAVQEEWRSSCRIGAVRPKTPLVSPKTLTSTPRSKTWKEAIRLEFLKGFLAYRRAHAMLDKLPVDDRKIVEVTLKELARKQANAIFAREQTPTPPEPVESRAPAQASLFV